MISTDRLTKHYKSTVALSDISINFQQGHVYALIGPNGSGKTTLIKSILGLVAPTSGKILIEQDNIAGQWKYREKIGYIPQIGKYPDNLSINQLFDMMKDIRSDSSTIDETLYSKYKLNDIGYKRMHTLSGGTVQKVSASLAFLFSPSIIILDEPTAGLDPVASEMLKEKILEEKQKGKLIIITSHIMNDLDELATDLVYLLEGKLIYQNTLLDLKVQTSEERLGKAVFKMLTQLNYEV